MLLVCSRRNHIGSSTLKILYLVVAAALLLTVPGMADGLSVGDKAPDFTLFTTSGEKFHLSDQNGTTVLMAFWSPWCSRSQDELSFLKRSLERYPSLEIAVVYSGDPKLEIRSLAYIQQTINEWELSASVLVDKGQKVWNLYNIQALPTSFIIDPRGVVAFSDANFYSPSSDELESVLGRMSALSMK